MEFSLGLVEVSALGNAIMMLDEMLKVADVEFVSVERKLGGRLVTIVVRGSISSVTASVEADTVLLDFLRDNGCLSVKRGCDTSNCGLCTVLMDNTPILSCSTLAVRADGHEIYTLEGLQEEVSDFVGFIADQGADQCGFCNPGFVMNTIALLRENPGPTDDEIRAFLAGNLCRCSGYDGQLRGIRNYLISKKV